MGPACDIGTVIWQRRRRRLEAVPPPCSMLDQRDFILPVCIRDQNEQAASELRQQLTAAEEARGQQEHQVAGLKQQLAAARGGEDQHAAEMAALATQLAVAAQDLDAARGDGELLQQRVQVCTVPHMASLGQSQTQNHKVVCPARQP